MCRSTNFAIITPAFREVRNDADTCERTGLDTRHRMADYNLATLSLNALNKMQKAAGNAVSTYQDRQKCRSAPVRKLSPESGLFSGRAYRVQCQTQPRPDRAGALSLGDLGFQLVGRRALTKPKSCFSGPVCSGNVLDYSRNQDS